MFASVPQFVKRTRSSEGNRAHSIAPSRPSRSPTAPSRDQSRHAFQTGRMLTTKVKVAMAVHVLELTTLDVLHGARKRQGEPIACCRPATTLEYASGLPRSWVSPGRSYHAPQQVQHRGLHFLFYQCVPDTVPTSMPNTAFPM